jgi:putative DNA primase/helicase
MKTADEILHEYGIAPPPPGKQRYYTTCPQCSANRSRAHQKAACLGVTVKGDGVKWGCNHCLWTGGGYYNGKINGPGGEPARTYDYLDEQGNLLSQKVRNPPGSAQRFWQRRPDGKGGWINNTQGVRKVLYRLPEMLEAIASQRTILVVEGEKDADSLWRIGIPATSSPDGASDIGKAAKWHMAYSESLAGADIVVIPDHDDAGYAHANTTVKASVPVAKRVRMLTLAKHWPECPKGGDISDWLAAGHTRDELVALMESAPDFVPQPLERGESESEQPEGKQAKARPSGPQIVLPPPSAPMAVARHFVETCCRYDGRTDELTLRYWCGCWWVWRTTNWVEAEPRTVRARLYAFTEHAVYRDGKGNTAPWLPNRYKIGDVLEALSAIVILPDDFEQPGWLDGRDSGPIVATSNGLLDIASLQLHPHTPLYFSQVSVPFPYDPDAPPPDRWLAFLDELWPQELDAIDVLGEWFGYVISGRLDLHKILVMVGPTRGGKGVIARILTTLIGKRNVCGPTLNSLGSEFGLAPLLGKSLAIISDARSGGGKNSSVVVERLLSISGEDTLTVNRKYRDQWSGKLPVRLHLISNELPRLGDASSAIVGRLVLLLTTRSWLGKENYELETVLRAELTGILNWSLDGLRRLTLDNENHFTRFEAAEEAIVTMQDLASPVGAFVRERCKLDSGAEIAVDELYANYKGWCEASEYPKSPKIHFGRDLRAACPSVRKRRPRDGSKRHFVYAGIRLRKDEEELPL